MREIIRKSCLCGVVVSREDKTALEHSFAVKLLNGYFGTGGSQQLIREQKTESERKVDLMIKLYQNTYVLYIFLCCHNLIYTGFSHSLIAIVFTMHWTTFPTGHSETLQTNNLQLFKRKYKIKCIHIKLVHTDLVFISRFRRKMQNSHCSLQLCRCPCFYCSDF